MQVCCVGMTQSLPFYKEALGCWWHSKAQVDASNLSYTCIIYTYTHTNYIFLLCHAQHKLQFPLTKAWSLRLLSLPASRPRGNPSRVRGAPGQPRCTDHLSVASHDGELNVPFLPGESWIFHNQTQICTRFSTHTSLFPAC